MTHRPVKSVLLIGPTGAGKTPLGELFEKKGFRGRRCFHFDFGHQLREAAESDAPPGGFTPAEHSLVRRVIEEGLLLENEHFPIAQKLLERFLSLKQFGGGDLLLLNGLPRHVDQAKDVHRIADVKGVILLECPPEDVHRRITTNAGRDRTGRADDGLDLIRQKLEIYRNRTAPLVDHYSKAGSEVVCVRVTATSTAEELHSACLAAPGSFL